MGTISMSAKERRRLAAFSQVVAGVWSLKAAAETLGISYRQAKRSFARWRADGDIALAHRSRGRVILGSPAADAAGTSNAAGASNPAVTSDTAVPASLARSVARTSLRRRAVAAVVAAVVERYADFGPTLAAEYLAGEGLVVPRETLRRWLVDAGVWTTSRRRSPHRSRRPRRTRPGALVQMDGSPHDWFEGRRAEATLMVAVDDATGVVFARFFEQETLIAAQETFQAYAELYGLPCALYVDQASIYRSDREPTPAEQAAGIEPATEFGRAMRELDVELIRAHSPQAKGRVERMNRTLQKRLTRALRQANIRDLAAANRFLNDQFLTSFNARFGRRAASSEDAHRSTTGLDLLRILSVQEERTVRNDWTVVWQKRVLQLPSGEAERVRPHDRVQVCEQRDGRLRVFLGDGSELTWSDVRESAESAKPRFKGSEPRGTEPKPPAIRSSQGRRPKRRHPWRKRLLTPSST